MLHKTKIRSFIDRKKWFTLLLCIAWLGWLPTASYAQQKVNKKKQLFEQMADPHVNFYEVKKMAEAYFKDIDKKKKGAGWKQYKRWEYHNEPRFYPFGKRDEISPTTAWNEVVKFRNAEKQRFARQRTKAANHSWEEVGPKKWTDVTGHWAPGIGRFTDIYVKPSNPNLIFAGTPSGGLWKTTNGGQNWTCKTDNLASLGVAGIAVDPNNSNIVYLATGDNENSRDTYSIGVLKSTNGGDTWQATGLNWQVGDSKKISKLIMHPTNANILMAAVYGGIYKTTNGGATWSMVTGFSSTDDVRDIEFHPTNSNIVYASTKEAFRSTDGGNTFTKASGVATASDRMKLTVTPANPSLVYAWIGTAMYRSTNSGVSYVYQGATPNATNQLWYDMGLAVSDSDPNEVHIGAVDAFRSFDGGKTWEKSASWLFPNAVGYVHADIHFMKYINGVLYVGSDGLLTKSFDKGTSFVDFTEGINNRQFYGIAVSRQNVNKVVGGSQDNGTTVYTGGRWHEWRGADGGNCAVDFTNENIIYGCMQQAEAWYKSTKGGMGGGNATTTIPTEGGTKYFGAWVTPYEMDHSNPDILYAGLRYGKIFKTTDGMQTWTKIGDMGGGQFDNMFYELAVAPSNSNYIYVSSKEKMWRTKNGGASWQLISNNMPTNWINDIAVHPDNPEKVAISYSGYGHANRVYTSSNAGNSWTNFSGNLPQIPANSLVYEKGSKDALYVGMEVGIYYRDNTKTNWESFMQGLPNVPIGDLKIHEGAQKLLAGTYGRGLWRVDLYSSTGSARPTANFSANVTTVTLGSVVNFKDESTNIPMAWNWAFPGGEVRTSTSYQTPVVAYYTPGTYQVSLTATNSAGSDTETKNSYIVVNNYTADIDYNDLNPNPTLTATDNWRSFQTGLADNSFGLWRNKGDIKLETNNRAAVTNNLGNIVPLAAGTLIAEASKWTEGRPALVGPGYTDWHGKTSYVGVQLTVNGNTHYGWLQLTVSADGQSVTVLDFAYEKQAGIPIKAGQKTGSGGGGLPTANFTANSSGTVGQPITFTNTSSSATSIAWEFPGGNPATSSANSPSVTWNTAGTYAVKLTATNSVGSNVKTMNVTISAVSVNYCNARALQTGSEHITNVTIGSINNNSASSGYGNYTSQTATVTTGSSQSLSVTPSASWSLSKLSVWVDWNRDGDFDDAGEATVTNGAGPYNVTLAVPSNAGTGATRMRIRLSYGNSLSTPCGDGWTGEVEDYTINVTGGSARASVAADLPKSDLNIAPNPNSGSFRVALSGSHTGATYLRVLDASGKLVINRAIDSREHLGNIKVSKKGVYYVQVISGSGIITRKVIVK